MRIAPVVVAHLKSPSSALWKDAVLAGAITTTTLLARANGIEAMAALRVLTATFQYNMMIEMDVTIHIPDDVAARLGTADLPRRVLEALAVEEFRQGRLTQPELRRLLGFATRQALDAFLKAHNVYMSYSLEDLEKDRDDLRRLGF